MSKLLVVSYTPRHERSNTKQLLDHFLEQVEKQPSKPKIEHLDLLKDVPDFFVEENLATYYKRNYGGQELTPTEAKSMAKMDRMLEQFLAADYIVLASPMYNFSFPAMMKAYLDSVLQKGKVFDYTATGAVGLLKDKKALYINTSGGEYSEENQNLAWEHAASLAKAIFQFCGFADINTVSAGSVNNPGTKGSSIVKADAALDEVVAKWFSAAK